MPDDEPQKDNPPVPPAEPKPADPPPPNDKLAADISRGLIDGLKALREQEQQEQVRSAAPPPPREIPIISDEEIDAAIEAGDKAKANQLRRQQKLNDQARLEQNVAQRYAPGIAAINQLSKQSIASDRWYKKYQTEVDAEMAKFLVANPGTIVMPDHWSTALRIVKGNHADEIEREAVEAHIRKARDDSAPPAAPTSRGIEREEPEPTTLAEEIGPRFADQFKMKSRAVGGRSEDAEVQLLDRAFRVKQPLDRLHLDEKGQPTRTKPITTVADYIKERRELQRLADEDPSLGLGS